jgi:Tol biopolymer transport system component
VLLSAAGARAQSGPPSSLAFHSNRAGNNNIYVMNPDGSDQVRVTPDTSNNQRPEVSPDGKQIVFASNRSGGGSHFEIFVMNADGSDVRQLTSTPVANTNTWPRWSPGGDWIAFQSNVSGAFQIHAIRPDGSAQRQLTDSVTNQFPAWSPDGTRLAVRRDVDLYVIDLTGGSDPVRLTATGPLNQMAAWSPDGTKIAFMSTREPGNYPSVFLMNADGTGQINLTPKMDTGTGTWTSRAPAWSPNGEYIYFTGIRPGTPGEQLHVMRADGSGQTPLTMGPLASAEATFRRVRPPVITSVAATPNVLWPASGRMMSVSVELGVSDDSDPAPACRITGVTSNESIAGTSWSMTGPLTIALLAQRSGAGTGRVYTLALACTNSSQLSSTTTVAVTVPHDQRK